MRKNPVAVPDTLENLPKYDVKPGLERIEFLLEQLDHPEEEFSSIHIAGSNGKGSVVAMISAALSGDYSVGEFTSPPLIDFSDRIRVAGENISEGSISRGVNRLKEPIERLRDKGNEPSYFEAATALGAWYFREKEVDLALLETGLGGRYDATNPVGNPIISLITSVDREHQNILGESFEEIARELVGIAKPGKPLVLGPSKNYPAGILEAEKNEIGCKIVPAEERTEVRILDFDWNATRYELQNTFLADLKGETIQLGLKGTFQERNLTTALTAIGELDEAGYSIGPEKIKRGLETASWPGRFQLLAKNPHLVADGAHNKAAIELIAREIARYGLLRPEAGRSYLVFSALKDKNIKGMLAALEPVVDGIYLTELDLTRAAPLKALERWAGEIGVSYESIASPKKAIEAARGAAKKEDSIYVTGSLYLVREAILSESRR